MNDLILGMLIGVGISIATEIADYLTCKKAHWRSIHLMKGEDGNLYGVPVEGFRNGEDFIYRCEKCWGLSEIETPFCPKCGRRMKMDE